MITTKPQSQQHVKILLNNGTLVEGIVENWTNEEVILISLDRESKLILPRPNDDIMLIKIVLDTSEKSMPTEKSKRKPSTATSELQEAFDTLVESPTDTPGRTENLAELRIQLAEAERAIIAEKMREHHIGNPSGANYTNIAGVPLRPTKLREIVRKRKS